MSSQIYFTSSRQRTPLLPPPVRLTRSAMAHLDETENVPNVSQRPSRASVPHKMQGRAMLARANKTERKTTLSGTENESSDDEAADEEDDEASEEEEDDDDDDDGDDESDQPAAFAPPRGHGHRIVRKAGRLSEYRCMFNSEDPVLYEDPHDLFGGCIEDDDDDDLYQAVDDISDDDEQNDEGFQLYSGDATSAVAGFLLEQTGSPTPFPESEHQADFILDQVDGLSAYGFGDDLDAGDGSGEYSSTSENGDLTTIAERHVHFGSDVEQMTAYGKSTSPSLTRALLPSALPFEHERHIYPFDPADRDSKQKVSLATQDAYDSDATEVISRPPTPAKRNSVVSNLDTVELNYSEPATTTNIKSKTPKMRKRLSRRKRGPPRGIFTVDQNKSWAILDCTGKRILQIPAANTNRHAWLDEMSQHTSTTSNSQSPLNVVEKLHDEDVAESVASSAKAQLVINTAVPDIMMAGLSWKSPSADSGHGQVVGPPESFFSNGLQLVGGDYAISPEPESDAYEEEVTPVSKKSSFPLAEFLEDFEDEDLEDEDSALPLYAAADENLTGDCEELFGHLNNVNVTAFRRSADLMFCPRPGTSCSLDQQMSPTLGSSFALPAAPPPTPTISHKRKASTTPYQDEKIYGDVTPVERKVVHISKRRKMTT